MLATTEWRDIIDWTHVAGSVRNDTGSNVTFVRIDIDLLDAAGRDIGDDFTYVGTRILRPGEVGTFEAFIPPHAALDHCVVSGAEGTPTSEAPNDYLTVTVTGTYVDAIGWTHVSGTVLNRNTTAANDVGVIASFIDGKGRTVASRFSAVIGEGPTAAPGATVPFELDVSGDAPPWNTIRLDPQAASPPAPHPGPGPFYAVGDFIEQQYRDFLSREADPGGFLTWWRQLTSGRLSGVQMIEQFLNSAEFGVNVAPVARLYFAYFRRIPDYDGLMFWVNRVRAGAVLAQVSQAFAGSPEFAATYGALTNRQFVQQVFHNVLGRPPDAAGLAYWTAQLDSGRKTRGEVMMGFSESAEYRRSMRAEVNVTMIYIGMLRRAPDRSGFDFWVTRVDAGASVRQLIGNFLGSAEYARRFDG